MAGLNFGVKTTAPTSFEPLTSSTMPGGIVVVSNSGELDGAKVQIGVARHRSNKNLISIRVYCWCTFV